MQKREILWIAVLLILGAAYYHFFGGRYAAPPLTIRASLRPSRRGETPVFPVYFTLDNNVKLTSIKVVPLNDDGEVDPATVPSWNLVADGKPTPVRAFFYGQNMKGMKPVISNAQPDVLTPGVIYRMTLSAGKQTTKIDFKTEPTR